jgi:hypothetical protein
MKRAIRISILIVGIVGTFLAAAVKPVPAVADGGPIITCPQPIPQCGIILWPPKPPSS